MKAIKLVFWGFLVALTALWLSADRSVSAPYELFTLRASLIYYSGIVAIGMMSAAMILAVRPLVFEPCLGGLDKMYRLHKWLGMSALVFSIAHWLLLQAPKWLIGLGWIERPARQHWPEPTSAILRFFQSQRGLAEGFGEWAFYATLLLIALALVKQFPYRYFFRTHRLLAVAYLFLVCHSVILMEPGYWNEIVAPVMALLMIAGSLAALHILLRKVGQKRRAVGVIDQITYHREIRVLEIGVKIKGRWNGHQAGQFAFVTFAAKEGAHPFTITSAWNGDGRMLFVIKELGDYTKTLPTTLKVGNPVNIEGPYGQFSFSSNKPRQIWIGGGIGITPFIARMKSLARQPDGKSIDLFYTTAALDEEIVSRLQDDARKAKVTLHVLVDARDGFLNAERIVQAVPKWEASDIWFCGPAGFGRDLRRDFKGRGIPDDDFHQELFDMR